MLSGPGLSQAAILGPDSLRSALARLVSESSLKGCLTILSENPKPGEKSYLEQSGCITTFIKVLLHGFLQL